MSPREVGDPSTPPSTLSSSSGSTCDSSESSEASDDISVSVASRSRCTNPGRRRIGGRIYDSVLGVTCHWCRQKTVEDHVFCCHCNIAFCGGCLRNRHGEDVEVEMKDDVNWTCPKCRGGCGPGCKNCCNCGPCRKAQGMEPTGLLVHKARALGVTNVHDYLIFLKTGESEETIAKRKQGKGWCQTDATSFRKKQKRVEDENGVETTCRKRLNFTAYDDELQVKRWDKSIQSKALQFKEASLASSTCKGEELSKVDSEGCPNEPEGKVSKPPSMRGQLKREPDPRVHKYPCEKRENPSLGNESNTEAHFQGSTVQPKLESDSHVQEMARNTASVSSLENATDVRSTNEGDAQLLGKVKEEPSDYTLHTERGANSNTFGMLRRAVTEEVPLLGKTGKDGHLCQVKEEILDQPGQVTEGLNVQLVRVKEEFQDQCSQPICSNGSTNEPNVFGAAFPWAEGDTGWCRFSEDLEPAFENIGGSLSTSAFLNCETPSNSGDGRSLPSSTVSNFHLYPERVLPLFSHVKEEVVDEVQVFTSDVAVKREIISSQEAQCNNTPCGPRISKGWKDSSIDATQFSSSSSLYHKKNTVAAVKEEPQEDWNVHYPCQAPNSTQNSSHTNSLLSNAKVQADLSFTIEPSVRTYPCISKTQSFSSWQVKQDVMVDTPLPKVISIDDHEAIVASEKDKVEIPAGLKKSSSLGNVSHLWKVDDFRNKLKAKLLEPFNRKELEELAAAASHRKPICKVRETRQGCFPFMSEEEGFSYLDHHPELDCQLEQAISPILKLSLLRGFFFWLEHASMQGAFKPWTMMSRPPKGEENDDCVEVEGLDCEILAVVCSVDEEA